MKKFIFSRLIRESSWSFLLRVFQAVCSFLTTVLLARVLGVEGYGIYAYAYAFVTLLTIPVQAGLPTLVVRETARGVAQKNLGLVQGIWRWSIKIALLISFIVLCITEIALILLKGRNLGCKEWTLFWALFLVPFVSLGNLRAAALRGLHKVVLGQLPEFLIRPFLFLVLCFVASFYFAEKFGPPEAMFLNVVSSIVAFLVGWWFLFKNTPGEIYKAIPIYRTKKWLKSLVPLAFTASMFVINNQTDVVMLGLLRSSREVGIYRVAVQFAWLSSFALQAINMVVAPHFATFYAKKELDNLQYLATRSARLVLFFNFLVALFFVFGGKEFLRVIFGLDFVCAYTPLLILLVGQLVNSAVGSVGFLLNMTGYEKYTAKGLALSAIVNVVLNAFLIPFFGYNGAAIATAISMAVWNVLLWWLVRKHLGINTLALRPKFNVSASIF